MATSFDEPAPVAQFEQGDRVGRRNARREPVCGCEGGVGRRAAASSICEHPAESSYCQFGRWVTRGRESPFELVEGALGLVELAEGEVGVDLDGPPAVDSGPSEGVQMAA